MKIKIYYFYTQKAGFIKTGFYYFFNGLLDGGLRPTSSVVRLGSYPPADDMLRAFYPRMYGFKDVPSPPIIRILDFR